MMQLDLWLLPFFFLGIGALLFLLKKKIYPGALNISSLTLFNVHIKGKALRYAYLPQYLYLCTALFFLLAFLDMRFYSPVKQLPTTPAQTEGVAIYIALDNSGSMGDKIPNAQGESVRKIDLLKEVLQGFIEHRPYDLIGLVTFARTPTVLAPMTTDQAFLLRTLDKIDTIKNPQQNATGIGYAIHRIVRLIEATRYFEEKEKKASHAAIILATDGLQTTYPDDKENPNRTIRIETAAQEALQAHIKLYIISIDPALADVALSPHRHMMQTAAKSTGGNLYIAQSVDELTPIYAEISNIEKSTQLQPQAIKPPSRRSFSLYPFFLSLSLGAFLLAFLLEQTLSRRTPS